MFTDVLTLKNCRIKTLRWCQKNLVDDAVTILSSSTFRISNTK